jgi:hypothetical protein
VRDKPQCPTNVSYRTNFRDSNVRYLFGGAFKKELNISPKVCRVDGMNPDTCLFADVQWRVEEVHEEVTQWFLASYRGSVFKVEGNVNERSTVWSDMALLRLKRLNDKLFVAGDVLARGELWECRGTFEWGSDHTPFFTRCFSKWKGCRLGLGCKP